MALDYDVFGSSTGEKSVVSQSGPAFISDLAVVYLARYAEGARAVTDFIGSYECHSPEIAHDLVVIKKGFPSRETALDKTLGRLFLHSVQLSDNGFDITAYASAAAKLPHRYVVFLNTFSEIAADGWLRKLHSAFTDADVGIAGATGSYESPLDSMKQVQKSWWLFQQQGVPMPAGVTRFVRAIRMRLPRWMAAKLLIHAVSFFATRSSRANCDRALDERFEACWADQIGPGGALERLNDMKAFPNPHIRTNAFMIERKLFLDLLPDSVETKNDTYLFENGPDGLTQRILRRGMKAVVVGADGRAYAVDEWRESGTFRLGDQRNLLVRDNQTRAFQNMNAAGKRAFAKMAWGDDQDVSSMRGRG